MAVEVTLKELLESGVHFGHQTRKWNPKMREYIFIARGGIHIIDLQKTLRLLNRATARRHRGAARIEIIDLILVKRHAGHGEDHPVDQIPVIIKFFRKLENTGVYTLDFVFIKG